MEPVEIEAKTLIQKSKTPSNDYVVNPYTGRRLIRCVRTDLDALSDEDRRQIQQAVTVVRRSSQVVTLGMPRVTAPVPTPGPERPSARPAD